MRAQPSGCGKSMSRLNEVRNISSEAFSVLLLCARRRKWGYCMQILGALCRLYLVWLFLCLLPLAIAFGVGVALAWLAMWLSHGKGDRWMYLTIGVSCLAGMVCGVILRRHADRANKTGSPPLTAQYLLLLVPPKYRENLVGDLEEEYWTRLSPAYGRRWAALWYWWQVVAAFGHFLLRLLTGLAAAWRLIR